MSKKCKTNPTSLTVLSLTISLSLSSQFNSLLETIAHIKGKEKELVDTSTEQDEIDNL
jgi:hypothetical protein